MILNVLIVLLGFGVFILGVWFFKSFSGMLNFFVTGLDSKFTLGEIFLLWKLASTTGLEDPVSLFVSDAALSRCVAKVVEDSKENHTENDPRVQDFLSKLYKFRTKLALSADSKRGLSSSRALVNGQKLRIVLKGSGIFASTILNNASEITITMPIQNGRIPIKANEWVGKEVNVYLWRKGDAGYVFDTKVLRAGAFLGKQTLFLRQSEDLTRMQKRRSIRTACKIPAQLYLLKESVTDYKKVEASSGYKCLIEDISSDGALLRIGGKGVPNIQIKLQFEVEGTMAVMYGVVKSVEFNSTSNQSRLHVECTHLEPAMRNAILTFVYKVIPEEQKNEEIAIKELQKEDGDAEDSEDKIEDPDSRSPADRPAESEPDASGRQNGLQLDEPEDIYKRLTEEIKSEYDAQSSQESDPI